MAQYGNAHDLISKFKSDTTTSGPTFQFRYMTRGGVKCSCYEQFQWVWRARRLRRTQPSFLTPWVCYSDIIMTVWHTWKPTTLSSNLQQTGLGVLGGTWSIWLTLFLRFCLAAQRYLHSWSQWRKRGFYFHDIKKNENHNQTSKSEIPDSIHCDQITYRWGILYRFLKCQIQTKNRLLAY